MARRFWRTHRYQPAKQWPSAHAAWPTCLPRSASVGAVVLPLCILRTPARRGYGVTGVCRNIGDLVMSQHRSTLRATTGVRASYSNSARHSNQIPARGRFLS
jgi:hypothetical protein